MWGDAHFGDWGFQMGLLIVAACDENPRWRAVAEETWKSDGKLAQAGEAQVVPVLLKHLDPEALDRLYPAAAAKAKTDEYLTLNVPTVYHDNQFRYFQIIERLPIVDTPELRARRIEQWGRELLDPKTAGQAALKLEGIYRRTYGRELGLSG